jgi:hypothetical protein
MHTEKSRQLDPEQGMLETVLPSDLETHHAAPSSSGSSISSPKLAGSVKSSSSDIAAQLNLPTLHNQHAILPGYSTRVVACIGLARESINLREA